MGVVFVGEDVEMVWLVGVDGRLGVGVLGDLFEDVGHGGG